MERDSQQPENFETPDWLQPDYQALQDSVNALSEQLPPGREGTAEAIARIQEVRDAIRNQTHAEFLSTDNPDQQA